MNGKNPIPYFYKTLIEKLTFRCDNDCSKKGEEFQYNEYVDHM